MYPVKEMLRVSDLYWVLNLNLVIDMFPVMEIKQVN